ncbi:MAG: acylneuraminate cytidylyltransferase family protein [Terrimicrobiaceae bacterium]
MKILAVIPARGGSKRVPQKNIRTLGGRSLIVRAIEGAQGIPEISEILVSTDDSSIAEIAKSAGAVVPWLRPAVLSTDSATLVDVALHALDWYEKEKGEVTGIMVLQPTCPFRKKASIQEAILLFKNNDARSVVSFSPAKSHPYWCYQNINGRMVPFVEMCIDHLMSQDFPPAYVSNGAIYLMSPETLKKERSFRPKNLVPLLLSDPNESIDIDTEEDWENAEYSCQMITGVRLTERCDFRTFIK